MPPAVGYVLRTFPKTSQTFIANEIHRLEQLGVPIRVYSLHRPRATVPHGVVRLIRAPVTYLPDPLAYHPLRHITANRALGTLERDRYRQTLRYVFARTLRERNRDTWRHFLIAADLARLIEADGVRHLHAHFAVDPTGVGMLASMLTGVPFSFTAHAGDIFNHTSDFRLLREQIDRAAFVVTVSHYNREFLDRHAGPLVDGKVRTLYNGIDLRKFSPDPTVERADDCILGVGRLVEKKGFSCLIRACRLLRDQGVRFRCQIAGDGGLRPALEDEVRRLGLDDVVALVGLRSQEELPALYQRATVFAMPAVPASNGNRDALPTVLLEALACGLPVVASRLTGIPEIVDDAENGLLVTPGDVPELARALAALLADPARRARFGIVGRAKAERCFDLARNVEPLGRLFAEALGEP